MPALRNHQWPFLHNGDITAESEGLGKGATFTVRLPLMQQQEFPFGDETPRVESRTA